jgi:hypothetical protein
MSDCDWRPSVYNWMDYDIETDIRHTGHNLFLEGKKVVVYDGIHKVRINPVTN